MRDAFFTNFTGSCNETTIIKYLDRCIQGHREPTRKQRVINTGRVSPMN